MPDEARPQIPQCGKPWGLAVKAFVRSASGEYLFIRRSMTSRHFRGQWELPGGKADEGEPFDAAARREVLEETGLAIEITGVAGAVEYEMRNVRVAILYLEGEVTRGELSLSAEHSEARWCGREEVSGLDLSEQLADFIRTYLAER